MENASKALVMAGGVLIALMILGALILMFNNLSSYQETDTETTRSAQITEFNNQFETYNRTNIRGSELYSLLNKVIDYNRRQSTEGTGSGDRGQELAYQPMEVTFKIDIKELSADGKKNRLFTTKNQDGGAYVVSKNKNNFEDNIKDKIESLENEYGQDSLTNLTTNLTGIFLTVPPAAGSEAEELVIHDFNEASKKVKITSYTEIQAGSDIREDVYTYYEYIQFKRAYFDCENVDYDNSTGRITKMDFDFTGKFN